MLTKKMTTFNFKINFLYNFHDGPWGGGNQFLKALKDEFIKRGLYEKNFDKADVIIFNSYHQLLKVFKIKIKYPNKIFIHRLGPVFHLHRGSYWKMLDKIIISISKFITDLIIFQSEWSYIQALKLGFQKKQKMEIIGNGITHKANSRKHDLHSKVKLIAASWSDNPKKGFKYYKFLDENLDFTEYEMVFVGNCPSRFKNIKIIPPQPQAEVLKILKLHDIFVSAVEDDACSNSLTEALSCGLPAVTLDSGGSKEITKSGGEVFKNNKDIIEKIEKVAKNYNNYQNNITVLNIKEIADKYLKAIRQSEVGTLKTTSIFYLKILYLRFRILLFLFKIYDKLIKIIMLRWVK